jgi:hypothetical protein
LKQSPDLANQGVASSPGDAPHRPLHLPQVAVGNPQVAQSVPLHAPVAGAWQAGPGFGGSSGFWWAAERSIWLPLVFK